MVGTEHPVVCRLSAAATPDLVEIEAHSNTPPWTERLFAQEFAHPFAQVFGARLRGQLVGFLVCHVVTDEAHIVNFAVRREHRGGGIGRALLEQVLTELDAGAVRWVTLEVRVGNGAARSLYESVGFVEAGIRERYYVDTGEDALLLRLSVEAFTASRRGA